MKISVGTMLAGHINKVDPKQKSEKTSTAKEAGRNFDQITINSNSLQMAEERLTTAAKKDITSAVYLNNAEDKVAALKEQVAKGQYQVDADAVAAKILFMGDDL